MLLLTLPVLAASMQPAQEGFLFSEQIWEVGPLSSSIYSKVNFSPLLGFQNSMSENRECKILPHP